MRSKMEYKGTSLKSLIERFAEERRLKIVVHFPHSSLEVPDSFWEDVDIDRSYFRFINLKMSDLLLVDLFADWGEERVIAPYSRLYVDVEKYWDEDREIMSKYGMGAVYEKDVFGRALHRRTAPFMKEAKTYYDSHHEALSRACESERDVLLLDMHSFNADMAGIFLPRDGKELPDLCLGFNDDESRCDDLLREILAWNEGNEAFRCALNYPYAGSIVPNRRQEGQRIYSLMFEWNKRWYL